MWSVGRGPGSAVCCQWSVVSSPLSAVFFFAPFCASWWLGPFPVHFGCGFAALRFFAAVSSAVSGFNRKGAVQPQRTQRTQRGEPQPKEPQRREGRGERIPRKPRANWTIAVQRTQRKAGTSEDRRDHLSGENPLSLKFLALRSLRSLRLFNCRHSGSKIRIREPQVPEQIAKRQSPDFLPRKNSKERKTGWPRKSTEGPARRAATEETAETRRTRRKNSSQAASELDHCSTRKKAGGGGDRWIGG